jgi:hypothetical protein
MILRVIGCLLLVAAGLKLHGLAVEPVGAAGFFSAPWVQMLILEWEIALGIWLISGTQRALAWLAATATFIGFAAVSFWQGWIGQVTCLCFGAIHVDPWVSFAIDLTALTLLGCARSSAVASQPSGQLAPNLRFLAVGACGVLLILGMFAAIGAVAFGSPAAALAYLRGERISIEPRLLDVGEGYFGEEKEVVVQVRNWTQKPIRVIGGTFDGGCVVTNDLPLTVTPGEVRALTVSVRLIGPAGQFTRYAKLFTDDEQSSTIAFRLMGRSHKPLLDSSANVQ